MPPEKKKSKEKVRTKLPEGVKLASEYQPKQLKWLWSGRLPLGKVSILEGDPSRGKSMMTSDWAARISTGDPWPSTNMRVVPNSKRHRRPRGVVMVCGEDDWEDTLVPRLLAAGADLSRIATITLHRDEDGELVPLSIPKDLDRIAEAVGAVDAVLLIIDPITAYLGERTDTHNDASTRRALMPLQVMSAGLNISTVLVRHLNKNTNLKAEYRGGGSIAFSAAARSVLIAERHPEEEGVFCLVQAKNNLAVYATTITYKIEPRLVETEGLELEVAIIEWGESSDLTLDQIMRRPDGRRDGPKRDACAKEIITLLGEQDPRPAKEMLLLLGGAGFSKDVIERAKKSAGVQSVRERDPNTRATSAWSWSLGGEGGEV